jgi:hypothetical protein
MRVRVLYIAAAACAAAALVLPLWGFSMAAPQYPDETLHLQVQRSGIVGDVHEIETLQHYIGVRFPTDMPELKWATRAIAGVAVLLLAAAFVGAGAAARVYRVLCAGALIVFLAASAAVVQARLYQVGHQRDPHSPLRGMHDFTPPLVGPAKVGNFTVWSFPHAGAVMLLMAAGLAVYGVRLKPDTTDHAGHTDGVRLQPDRSGKAVA